MNSEEICLSVQDGKQRLYQQTSDDPDFSLSSKLPASVIENQLIIGNVEVHPRPPAFTKQQSFVPFLEEKKAVIEELITNTEDNDMRQMLSRYIPDKPANEIEQSLSEIQITKDRTVKTIKYLDVNQDIAESTAKAQLIKETIISIERCMYCNEMYFIKHD